MTRYPTLARFFGAYLHEDWHEDCPDEWAALDDFLADGPPQNAQAFRTEIAALLADHPDDDDVRRIVLDELDSCYLADAMGWKYRDWLQALSKPSRTIHRTPTSIVIGRPWRNQVVAQAIPRRWPAMAQSSAANAHSMDAR